jgi:hypothetical protein
MYHGGSMGKSTEMIDLVGEGAIEIGNFSSGYNFARLPMQAFFGVPIVMKDAPMVGKLLRSAAKTQTKMQDDWKKNNLQPYPIGLVEEEVAAVGGDYKKAARIYADFLRAEIARLEKENQ